MPHETLLFLANMSFDIGFIGIDEYDERICVADWVFSDSGIDPRQPSEGEESTACEKSPESQTLSEKFSESALTSMEFIAFNTWYFTGSDPDCYPSIPHGHYQNENRPWPKLNPYTGRAFSTKHKEDSSLRLKKKEMRQLWSDQKFIDYCRKHIMWYMQEHSHYRFSVLHPLRLPKW